MCNHVYTADYSRLHKSMGNRCPYPERYERERSSANPPPPLPIDNRGECIFHSRDVAWKRESDFSGHFLELVRLLTFDTAAQYYDFAEFVFVGGGSADGDARSTFRIADMVFPKAAYFTASSFLDPLALEGIDFRDGADFQRAVFAGDLQVLSTQFRGLDATAAEFHEPDPRPVRGQAMPTSLNALVMAWTRSSIAA